MNDITSVRFHQSKKGCDSHRHGLLLLLAFAYPYLRHSGHALMRPDLIHRLADWISRQHLTVCRKSKYQQDFILSDVPTSIRRSTLHRAHPH